MNRAEYHAARFLVMRYAPRIGWPESPNWISVAGRAPTLVNALGLAAVIRTDGRGSRVWIAARGAPATLKRGADKEA